MTGDAGEGRRTRKRGLRSGLHLATPREGEMVCSRDSKPNFQLTWPRRLGYSSPASRAIAKDGTCEGKRGDAEV